MKFLLIASLFVTAALAQNPVPELLHDIYHAPGTITDGPQEFCAQGDTVFFSGYSRTTGRELWKTDGTKEGTQLVKDIYPGTDDSRPAEIVALGNFVYFAATNGLKRELWKSDGTAEGTVRFKELSPSNLTLVGDHIFFVATSGETSSLWTIGSTAPLGRPVTGGDGLRNIKELTAVGDVLYFSASTGAAGQELYKGTPTGCSLVKDFGTWESSDPHGFTALNGIVYYAVTNHSVTSGIYRTDGTETGTYLVKERPGGRTDFYYPQTFGDHIYFLNNGDLWRTDGTEGGTILIKDFESPFGVTMLISTGGKLYLCAETTEYGIELWTSDGTEQGTVILKDIAPGDSHSFPKDFIPVGDLLYFFNHDSEADRGALWRTNGTSEGTWKIANAETGQPYEQDYAVVGQTFYFQGILTYNFQYSKDLWKCDGTEAGTVPVVRAVGNADPIGTVAFRDGVAVSATDGIHGRELWFVPSDGTEAVLLADIRPGPGGSFPKQMTVAGDLLYFLASPGDGENDRLYVSDGTPAGTHPLKTMPAPQGFPERPANLIALGDELLFTYDDGIHGNELWSSRGDIDSTRMVKDIVLAEEGSMPIALTKLNDLVYFFAYSPESGRELWRTDGTAQGTSPIKVISPYSEGILASRMVVVGDELYFLSLGYNNDHKPQLWKSDGTAQGTVMVKAGSESGWELAGSLLPADGKLYFTATTSASGEELWVSDGTNAGTNMIEIRPGTFGAFPRLLASLGSKVILAAVGPGYNDDNPWVSDGTAAGTFRLTDMRSDKLSPRISNGVRVEDRVYFSADDGVHGGELWVTDGTTAGTKLVADIAAGSGGSSPTDLVFTGNRLVFSATTDEVGTELFSMPEGRDLEIRVGSGSDWQPALRALDFGSPLTGSQGQSITLSLKNRGWHPLDLSSVVKDGANSSDFTLAAPAFPRVLARGESIELMIGFAPSMPGDRSASLKIASTDYDQPETIVALTGFGNTAPQFGDHHVIISTIPATISLSSILADASDANGDDLTLSLLTDLSSQGGRIVRNGNLFVYIPLPGFRGTDSFGVVISDSRGASVEGLVTITIPEHGVDDLEITRPSYGKIEGSGQRGLHFKGIPRVTYRILKSTDLLHWEEIATKAAGEDGKFEWEDLLSSSPKAFYRIEGPGFR